MPCKGLLGAKGINLSTSPSRHIHTRLTPATYSMLNFGDNGMRSHMHVHNFWHNTPAHGTAWRPRLCSLTGYFRLLPSCPDRRLRRIARLSHLSDFGDLNEEDTFIYVLFGPFAPDVGQTGCITTARLLMQRYKEHLRTAKALYKHFQSPKRRRYRKLFASLAHLLTRNGPAPPTIFTLLKLKPNTQGRQPERWWVRVPAPTLKKVLPFGGTYRLRSEALLQQKPPKAGNRTLTAWI